MSQEWRVQSKTTNYAWTMGRFDANREHNGKNKRGRHESPHEANERIMRKLISRHFLSQGQYNMVTGAVIFNGVSEEQQQVRFPSLVGPQLGLSVMSVAISN